MDGIDHEQMGNVIVEFYSTFITAITRRRTLEQKILEYVAGKIEEIVFILRSLVLESVKKTCTFFPFGVCVVYTIWLCLVR